MSASTASSSSNQGGTGSGNGTSENGTFECYICLDTANDPVVTKCGHLFCWACLHQVLESNRPKNCPVCKSGISAETVIPVYGRGNSNQKDPREKLPPRPPGQRSEPENNGGFQNFGFGDGGFQMSFGIGAFPFGFFASTFHLNDGRPQAPQAGSAQAQEEQFLSRVFLWVAVLFIFWLLIA